MSFKDVNEGVAASVFLAVYTLYTIAAAAVVVRKGIWSTFSHLLMYGLIRVGAQICGVGFCILGIVHYQWLMGYLILGVEGYFVLVLSAFYLLGDVYHQSIGVNKFKRSLCNRSDGRPIKFLGSELTFSGIIISYMIIANVLLAVGGSLLCSLKPEDYASSENLLTSAKGLRAAGQIIFLVMTINLAMMTVIAQFKDKLHHPNVALILAACPFLLVRAIYGLLSCFVAKMNYVQLSNYSANGLSSYFVATEYCLATTMEFISAVLLLLTYWHHGKTEEVFEIESKSEYV